MRVLHVCADYGNQALYVELLAKLQIAGATEQLVFVARRGVGGTETIAEREWAVTRASILKKYHRVLFGSKVRRVQNSLMQTARSFRPNVIHAHFLYSDGVPSLEVSRALGVPLIVSVRNTDLNFFSRFRPDLDDRVSAVFSAAGAVVVLTPAYKRKLVDRFHEPSLSKARVVPNGVADFWLDNAPATPESLGDEVRVSFVGELTKNKNVLGVIEAVERLAVTRPASLTIAGDGPLRAKVERAAERSKATVKVVGHLSSPQELMAMYRSSTVFAMPSYKETFGISYVEALSQGLPVVHSRGEGVDGLVKEGLTGFAVDPKSPGDIAGAIERAHENRLVAAPRCMEVARRCDWSVVSKDLFKIYCDAGARE